MKRIVIIVLAAMLSLSMTAQKKTAQKRTGKVVKTAVKAFMR